MYMNLNGWDDPVAMGGYSALPPNRGGLGGVFAHERADAWHN